MAAKLGLVWSDTLSWSQGIKPHQLATGGHTALAKNHSDCEDIAINYHCTGLGSYRLT